MIGAGIGGLTAAALLAHRGYEVVTFDQAIAPGGCASTFKRRGFTFDVGATQVAGLEPGGIHHEIFQELNIPVPTATTCDPACAVYLPDETNPISVWRDSQAWEAERLAALDNGEAIAGLPTPPTDRTDAEYLEPFVEPLQLAVAPESLATLHDHAAMHGHHAQ